ncbi:MAG: UPF0182 family protein [Deltaproteobacteria bacterium]|nr:UPF0182 family protein [Deltaproteobacteria bacterium]
MYMVLLVILLAAAVFLVFTGIADKKARARVVAGAALAVLTVGFFWFLGFWGEALWFSALGFSSRFWKEWLSRAGFLLAGGGFAWAFLRLLLVRAGREKRRARTAFSALAAVIGAGWGYASWDTILVFANGVETQVADPIFGLNTGFYLFHLPFYDGLYELLWWLSLVGVAACAFVAYFRLEEGSLQWDERTRESGRGLGSLTVAVGIFLLILAWGRALDRYHLMYSTWGVVSGPGWTDLYVRLPGYWVTLAVCLLGGASLIVPPVRGWLVRLARRWTLAEAAPAAVSGGAVMLVLVVWGLVLGIIPGLFQWLIVEPNEITYEEPFIKNNIRFTRMGFGLDVVESYEFPAAADFTRDMVQRSEGVFENVRLWDPRALDAVYEQFQEIRLYYEFADVDVDRYHFGGDYRQVMISAREMVLDNLPQQSQTFVNRVFKYTHGYGATLCPVSKFTSNGLPVLLVKDIPPVAEYPSLKIEHPQIYYGELTRTHVVGNSSEPEFDYPAGDANEYIHYPGKGGVGIGSLWRRFLFGWKFSGIRLLLSGYPREGSVIMFHRQVRERVGTVAPFLKLDNDPYVVIHEGRLKWIVDAYTISEYFPYSEPYFSRRDVRYGPSGLVQAEQPGLGGINYVRNAVKAVVDALDGTVTLYVYEPEDPVIRTWQNIFPGLFKDKKELSENLQAHVRYPSDLLLAQGLVYAKYHMENPAVFYNQEDLWVRATETYYGQSQSVDPYYIMWEVPGEDELQFVLMLPFTPKNKQVLIGWIAGMCDPDNYGRFLAYRFPKEKRVLGTQQVETKIDQDPYLSAQLSLWDQRGSSVIRGNVLVIPVDDTLLYVEPIYLKARASAYPELRLVVIMHGDTLSYAQTFEQALAALLEKGAVKQVGAAGRVLSQKQLIDQASQAFDSYLKALGARNYDRAAQALGTLEQSLNQLSGGKGEGGGSPRLPPGARGGSGP